MEDTVPTPARKTRKPPATPSLHPNERSALLAKMVKEEIATDPVVAKLRQRIIDRCTVIQKRCARKLDQRVKREFMERLKKAGVPIYSSETNRWSDA